VPLVTPEECVIYEAQIRLPQNTRFEATSEENFCFNVLGTARSPWNKSAARIFAGLAIRQLVLPNNLEIFNAISKAFETYLESIIRRYKTSLKTAEDQARLHSKLSQHGRKYQVCLTLHIGSGINNYISAFPSSTIHFICFPTIAKSQLNVGATWCRWDVK
jgi:hypothetical protein